MVNSHQKEDDANKSGQQQSNFSKSSQGSITEQERQEMDGLVQQEESGNPLTNHQHDRLRVLKEKAGILKPS